MRPRALPRAVGLTLGLAATVLLPLAGSEAVRGMAAYAWGRVRGGHSVAERVAQHGPAVQARLRPVFEAAGLPYPPAELALLAFKDSRHLEVYARAGPAQRWQFVQAYPILGASGGTGPKLAEGDRQVPEGLYRAESLNPNSRFHLAIRLNYPNAFDLQMAQADGRTRLGGDIMIHGGSASVGCLAMGDRAAEDLFVLAALAGPQRVRVVISPIDFRLREAQPWQPAQPPPWAAALYESLRAELRQYRRSMWAPGRAGASRAAAHVHTAGRRHG